MPKMIFEQAVNHFKLNGFYLIVHPVIVHHMLKDFEDYEVNRYAFYIKPFGEDFIHVAVIEHDTDQIISWDPQINIPTRALQVRYALAGDDLLLGLRVKYNNGGALDPEEDIVEIDRISKHGELPDPHVVESTFPYNPVRTHPRYIRKRFRHGRRKAMFRAWLVMFSDWWKRFRS